MGTLIVDGEPSMAKWMESWAEAVKNPYVPPAIRSFKIQHTKRHVFLHLLEEDGSVIISPVFRSARVARLLGKQLLGHSIYPSCSKQDEVVFDSSTIEVTFEIMFNENSNSDSATVPADGL